MYSVPMLLGSAGVRYELYRGSSASGVFVTAANQLVGTYASLRRFQQGNTSYAGWDVHHIVEDQDFDRLGVRNRVPPYAQQICVLIPKAAHAKRINSLFRNQNPSGVQAAVAELKRTYRDAYWLIGDYC